MVFKRLYHTVRLYAIRSGRKRADYVRKKKIYAGIGENVTVQSRVIPLYAELIKFHNNISLARNVDFVTHDIIHVVLNRYASKNNVHISDGKIDVVPKFREKIGCIEIMDNVFVGSNSVIMYGTRIGPNVIIASGSVVTKDCEPNSVYAGVPARRIGSFDEYMQKRYLQELNGEIMTTGHNQHLTDEEIAGAWARFYADHSLK